MTITCIGYIMTQSVTLKRTVLGEPGIKPVSACLQFCCIIWIAKHEASLKLGSLSFLRTRHYVNNDCMTNARTSNPIVRNLIFQVNSVKRTAPTKALYAEICQGGSSDQKEEQLARKPSCTTVESAKLIDIQVSLH